MKLIKHDQTIPESPSQCTEKKIFEGETSDGRNTETPKHRGTITHSSVVPVANFMESWRCGGGVQRRPKHYAR